MSNNKPILVSFGVGRTSAFLCYYLMKSKEYRDRKKIFVFANTGKERQETFDFAKQCDEAFNLNLVLVEAVINPKKGIGTTFKKVSFETANKTGKPFEDMIKKYGLPNKTRPHCTRELKITPIHKYMRYLGYKANDYDTAIGYRIDEAHRATKKKNFIYPLLQIKVNKEFIRSWWDTQAFDLKLKDYQGNCDLCWKKSKRKLLTLIVENPNASKWWLEMERKYGEDEYTFYRENTSMVDLIELSKSSFWKAVDEHEVSKNALRFDYDLDFEMQCFCSNL